MSVIDFDNGVVAETVRAGRRNFRRLVAFAVGLGMWSSVLVLAPGPTRVAIAVGAIVMLWVGLRPPRRTDATDPELVAIIHDRIAGIEEGAADALRQTADELSSLRQRIDSGP